MKKIETLESHSLDEMTQKGDKVENPLSKFKKTVLLTSKQAGSIWKRTDELITKIESNYLQFLLEFRR